MIREVVEPAEQADGDARQRLDWCCRRLTRLDPDLVEWTFSPAGAEGKRIAAELLLTDARRPLEQLATLLRRVANEVCQLTLTSEL